MPYYALKICGVKVTKIELDTPQMYLCHALWEMCCRSFEIGPTVLTAAKDECFIVVDSKKKDKFNTCFSVSVPASREGNKKNNLLFP